MPSKWKKRTFDSPWVTEFPPGPHVGKLASNKVYVTSPGFDNIGEILTSMNVEYEPFAGQFDCSILFVNCGTQDHIETERLSEFVRDGGCVYASDHADTVIASAFPGLFDFAGHRGAPGPIQSDVLDPELREVLGSSMTITFDMSAWAQLRECRGETLLQASKSSRVGSMPLMAYAEHGKGSVFFTCFHNKSQTSGDERRLLQLLVLKQMSTVSSRSLREVSRSVGFTLPPMRSPK